MFIYLLCALLHVANSLVFLGHIFGSAVYILYIFIEILQEQQISLAALQHRKDIIYKPLGKVGKIVLMTSQFYKELCLNILGSSNWYKCILAFRIEWYNFEFHNMLKETYSEDLLDKDNFSYLNAQFPKIPTLYCLPKTHKSTLRPVGQPIGVDLL